VGTLGPRTEQSFDFVATTVSDTEVFDCDPPFDALRLDARPGEHWRVRCSGHSTSLDTEVATRGTYTYVGPAMIRVDGRAVPALHFRTRLRISGDQHGTERMDTWYWARNGLPLELVRDIDVATPSPLGDVTYREQGRMILRSLAPRR
jgi:hypothetical protein